MKYARDGAVERVRTSIIHDMYLNNHIASIMSMYESNKDSIVCDKTPQGGVFYFTKNSTPCYLKKALWFIGRNINKNILTNRYMSFPDNGVLYFFDKKKYSGLTYSQYSDAITMSGRFHTQALKVSAIDNPLSYRAAISGLNEVYMDKVTGEPVLTLVAPVIDYSTNKAAGALFQDLTQSTLKRMAGAANFPSWVNLALSSKKAFDITLCFHGNCKEGGVGFYQEDYANELVILFGIDWLELALSDKFLLLGWLGYAIISLFIFSKFADIELRHKFESFTDELTRVYNRKALNEMNFKHFKSFIIFDCNDFKKINDTYGHPAGDAALIHIANYMKSNVRKTDVLVRYGGDEFIVLCKNNEAASLASRIQSGIKSHPLHYNGVDINLTVSYGSAEVSDSFMSTLYDADKQLYSNKKDNKAFKMMKNENRLGDSV